MGISYGGISQLFTAQTNPPSLAAITPLSLIDADADDALPGRNPQHRVRRGVGQGPHRGRPAGGPRRQGGAALGLRADPGGRPDLQGEPGPARAGCAPDAQDPRQRHYRPRVADPLSPVTFVDKIKAPVFMACQWQDEQTGGHCPTLAVALHERGAQVVHVHERHPRGLARPGDRQPLVRLPPALCRQASADRVLGAVPGRRAGPLRGGVRESRGSRCRPTRSSRSPPTRARSPPSSGSRSVRILFDNGAGSDAGRAAARVRAVVRELPGPRHHRALVVLRAGRRARRRRAVARRGRARSRGTRGRAG